MVRLVLTALLGLSALVLTPLKAGAEERGTLTLTAENDVVSGQDRHYTNGLRVAYVTAPVEPTRWERALTGADAVIRRSFSLSQQIYTPQDIFTETPDPDDHPYAGYLFGEAAVLSERAGRWDLFTLELGVIGPAAMAEETQNWFHRRMHFLEAEGWDHQMDNEVAVNIAYDWKGRPWAEGKVVGLDIELTPVAGASLGTVDINVRGGAMVRLGPALQPSFGPARIRPSLTATGHFSPAESWYVFAGVEGRAVAHDVFLDGSLFQDSPSTAKNPLVGDAQAGIVFSLGRAQLSWTMVARSKRYEAQESSDAFGAFSVSFKL